MNELSATSQSATKSGAPFFAICEGVPASFAGGAGRVGTKVLNLLSKRGPIKPRMIHGRTSRSCVAANDQDFAIR